MTDIETSHGSKASGVAKAGLTLGIIGTSLAVKLVICFKPLYIIKKLIKATIIPVM